MSADGASVVALGLLEKGILLENGVEKPRLAITDAEYLALADDQKEIVRVYVRAASRRVLASCRLLE